MKKLVCGMIRIELNNSNEIKQINIDAIVLLFSLVQKYTPSGAPIMTTGIAANQ